MLLLSYDCGSQNRINTGIGQIGNAVITTRDMPTLHRPFTSIHQRGSNPSSSARLSRCCFLARRCGPTFFIIKQVRGDWSHLPSSAPLKLDMKYRMSPSRRIVWMLGICWSSSAGLYGSLTVASPRLAIVFDIRNLVQCVVPLVANAGLLLNAGTPHWRRTSSGCLIALSCTL